MSLLHSLAAWYLKRRCARIDRFTQHPLLVQQQTFRTLVQKAASTDFGRKHDFRSIRSEAEFRRRVPLTTYEDFYPWIGRTLQGEANVIWPGRVNWFAKSSGTTNDRSKYIPVTADSLRDCHFASGKDMLAMYFRNRPRTTGFAGLALSVGGSLEFNPLNGDAQCGDLSAVLIQNMPRFYEKFRVPGKKTALLPDWETKLDAIAREALHKKNITTLVGVPSWTSLLLKRVLELSGKSHMLEVWPRLEVFYHGGVSFDPYRALFHKLIPGEQMQFVETYNASEGFFGIQDQLDVNDLLLLTDAGIFYEFILPEESASPDAKIYSLEEVKAGQVYALVISTNGGLWRYLPGDTVRFTSVAPYRFKVAGRTRHFLNAFGEELMVETAEAAIASAASRTGALVSEFTAAPLFFTDGSGTHQWLVEFLHPPSDVNSFLNHLDQVLRELNSDYDAKRTGEIALRVPQVTELPRGTFHEWLRRRNKLGGQNKIPRLTNDRKIAEELLAIRL